MHGRAAAPRSLVFPLFLAQLLLHTALLGSGGLTAAVAFAASATAAAALAVRALPAARRVPAVPPTRVRTAIRDRARRTAFLSQRDPDAPGRRRPRAPGHAGPATSAA
ncbi:DUF6412 domain-containing protein [Streptomyces sp. NPDC017638]|uniref:DUF6412 domain-containing protein n=1 Tax=Streptomyces sp. NPDC017638 TaxID=3365004 RepID=UPI003794508E